MGVIKPVQTAVRLISIVPVDKPNKAVRICKKYKCNVNTHANMQRYQLPHTKELQAALASCNTFSKVDSPTRTVKLKSIRSLKSTLCFSTTKDSYVIPDYHSDSMALPLSSKE